MTSKSKSAKPTAKAPAPQKPQDLAPSADPKGGGLLLPAIQKIREADRG